MTEAAARLATILADRYRVERELGRGGMTFVMVRRNAASRIVVMQNFPELVRRIGGGTRPN